MTAHFGSSEHALAGGIVLGALVKASTEGDMVKDVRPFYDAQGNYTNQMLVQIGNRHFTITIDEATSEAMR